MFLLFHLFTDNISKKYDTRIVALEHGILEEIREWHI